ncbi:MAG: LemA family protein [Planctomycetota bacterium]
MTPVYLIVGLVVLAILVVALLYNSLVGKKNQVENAFAGMDALLKKRYDLIPNLVSAVQRYMRHEAGVLKDVTALRARAMNPNATTDEKVEANNLLGKALGGILVAVEQYPDLKANASFLHLQASLNEVEEQISAARRNYNAWVTDLNNAVEMFPTNLLASLMGYERRRLFDIPESERQAPNVKALFQS